MWEVLRCRSRHSLYPLAGCWILKIVSQVLEVCRGGGMGERRALGRGFLLPSRRRPGPAVESASSSSFRDALYPVRVCVLLICANPFPLLCCAVPGGYAQANAIHRHRIGGGTGGVSGAR